MPPVTTSQRAALDGVKHLEAGCGVGFPRRDTARHAASGLYTGINVIHRLADPVVAEGEPCDDVPSPSFLYSYPPPSSHSVPYGFLPSASAPPVYPCRLPFHPATESVPQPLMAGTYLPRASFPPFPGYSAFHAFSSTSRTHGTAVSRSDSSTWGVAFQSPGRDASTKHASTIHPPFNTSPTLCFSPAGSASSSPLGTPSSCNPTSAYPTLSYPPQDVAAPSVSFSDQGSFGYKGGDDVYSTTWQEANVNHNCYC